MHPGGRRRRRRRQRDQPDGRGRDRGRRVPGDQHRSSVAPAVGGARDLHIGDSHHARTRVGIEPRARARRGARGVRPDQGDAARLGHGVHRRRRRRRNWHRRGADRCADRARAGRAHRRDRHPSVPVRGHPSPRPGRGGDRDSGRRGRHADRRAEQPAAVGARRATSRWSRRSASPTTCFARASRGSPIWSRCPG